MFTNTVADDATLTTEWIALYDREMDMPTEWSSLEKFSSRIYNVKKTYLEARGHRSLCKKKKKKIQFVMAAVVASSPLYATLAADTAWMCVNDRP